jgi:hypothetical protein
LDGIFNHLVTLNKIYTWWRRELLSVSFLINRDNVTVDFIALVIAVFDIIAVVVQGYACTRVACKLTGIALEFLKSNMHLRFLYYASFYSISFYSSIRSIVSL